MSEIIVIIVDDSSVACGLMVKALNDEGITTVSTVSNAASAIGMLSRRNPDDMEADIIVLDSDMPDMDGLEALPEIRRVAPDAKILMTLPLDNDAVQKGVRALELGATDYIVKITPTEDAEGSQLFKQELAEKVISMAATKFSENKITEQKEGSPTAPGIIEGIKHKTLEPQGKIKLKRVPDNFTPEVIAISSSTGGPNVLAEILRGLSGKNIEMPIFVTQHMPRDFTGLLAEQLTSSTGVKCIEAQQGMDAINGNIYIARGGHHMLIEKIAGKPVIAISDGPEENYCKPAADPMLRSIIEAYGGNKILSVVLTGMGKDGLEGCKMVAEKGGLIIAQNYETSTVWGMPGAVANAGICSYVSAPEKIAYLLKELSAGKIT